MNKPSTPGNNDLKQRLAGLNASQRALLSRRLGEGKSDIASAHGTGNAIPRARPVRMEEHPPVAVYPASNGQKQMWFLQHYAPESPAYNVPSAFLLTGPLNVNWLEAAFQAVIQRHDILRTTFALENSELVQRVAASSGFQIQQLDLEKIPVEHRKAEAGRCIAGESCRPFDLAAGLPFRAMLVRLQPTEHVLLVVMHHIISDGWSRSNFYRDLAGAYAAQVAGVALPAAPLPVQFADYSAWQNDWLGCPEFDRQADYWKTKLAGEPEPLDLPSDHPRPTSQSFRGETCSRRLEPDLMATLKTRAQEEGATLFMILLAAFNALLHRHTGQEDLAVGVPVANRHHPELEGLIGFFVNTLVMRTSLAGDCTFRELLRRVKETAVEAYAHQDMPIERLVELLQVRRDASRAPLFQASFALQDFPAVTLDIPGIQAAPWPATTHSSKFDLSLIVEKTASEWTATVEYATDLFSAERMERLLEQWCVILDSVAAHPDQRLSEISPPASAKRNPLPASNDQVDRKILKKPDTIQAAATSEYVAPRNERERKLVAIWQEALRRKRIGVRDNFFELGGHSLLGMAICSRLSQEFQVEASLRWIFEHPTIEGLAKLLDVPVAEEKIRRSQPTEPKPAANVLESGAETSPEPAAPLSRMTESERQRILVEWNRTTADFPEDRTIHELFELQAEKAPDAVAVICGDEQVTYQKLNRRANQLAHHLLNCGVKADSLVGVCLERSWEMVAALLGILKAGAAFVPLDPAYPLDRLAGMAQDSRLPILITQNNLLGLCNGFASAAAANGENRACKIISLDGQEFAPVCSDETNPENSTAPGNLAYVIFTSGSTGKPKGVLIEHRSLVNHLHWRQQTFPVGREDRFLQKANLSFDIAVWEILNPILFGAQLVLARTEAQKDPRDLVRLMKERSVTTAHFGPALLQRVVDEPEFTKCTSLRRIFCGGEPLPGELQKRFFARCNAELISQYGPTEATVDVTWCRCDRANPPPVAPIGRPIANTRIYILDQQQRPTPIGVTGELHIGGVALARGYLNQPDLTAEKFIADPFDAGPGARLYKTGDLCRYRADGNIEFLGRLDQQVKIRGYRTEPGEIEICLGAHPEVAACAVVAQDQEGMDKVLVAFVVSRNSAGISPELLRSWLRRKLPDHMIPTSFRTVPKLPLNSSAKVDRKALEKLEAGEMASATEYLAPRNEREQKLVEIWESALNRKGIGVRDDFFDLGGHSLLGVAICSRLNAVFRIEASLRWIFEHPTIEGLAAAWPDPGSGADLRTPQPQATPPSRSLSLSPGQLQLWFLDQLEPRLSVYILPLLLRLRGPLNVPALRRSLTALVQRHESLRTIFPTENHLPLAHVLPGTEVPLKIMTLGTTDPNGEWEARRLAGEFVREPFNLATGPVFRAGLVRLDSDNHILALAMHHISSDGWSLEVMQRDLAGCYRRVLHGHEPDWAPLPLQYADFVDWQHRQLTEGKLARQLGYWRQQLAGVPSRLELPADFPRSARQAHRGAIQSGALSPALTQDLKQLAQTYHATLFLVVLGAFEVLLQRLSGQDEFVLGTPANGRLLMETQEMVGFFVNTLPLRADLTGEPTFLELLHRCREIFMRATENQGVSFHQIVTELQTKRDPSRTPLFQVFINHMSYARQPGLFEGLETQEIKPATVDAKFDLTLYFEERDGQLQMELVYDRSLFHADRIKKMARQFESLLEQVAGNPACRIGQYSLATPAAPDVMADSPVPVPAPWTGNLADRFREQAGRTPNAEAIVLAEQSLTYGELNYRSDQLAQHLQKLGVGPEVMVGLCLERSLEVVVALLAVLKAGGAVVLIEPDLPKERIEYILVDTQMPWLLTQSSLLAGLSATGVRMLCLDKPFPPHSDTGSSIARDSEVKPETLAFVFYTSGSTGRPKGVLISQESYLNYAGPAIAFWQLTPSDRTLQFARFGFDVSIDQILTPLLVGATVVMRDSEIWDPARFTEVIRKYRLTTVHLPSAYWQKWVESLGDDAAGQPLGQLRLIQVGGDVMSVAAVRRWRELKISGVRLLNRYGPTETTMFCTACEVSAEPPSDGGDGRIPIGRPVGHRTVHVLDAHQNPVPAGATGEIYIGGATVACGYLNQAELNAERFIPDPFSLNAEARLYRTGDLGRWRSDGNLDFHGRADYQVKIRGYRIELGEIEAVLGNHPGVATCAVVVRQRNDGDKMLMAHVAGRSGSLISSESLRTWLGEKLPDYMIPSQFVRHLALPLNANGKVDRKVLEKIEEEQLPAAAEYVAPRNEREENLAIIWRSILRHERVGVRDNFFELGGHSLLAVVICSKIKEQLGVEVPLRWIFEHPTIERLANRLAAPVESSSITSVETAVDRICSPASFAQLGMWLLQQTLPDPATYNQPFVWHLSGAVDRDKVRRSLEVIQARHAVLRTALVLRDEVLWQRIFLPDEVSLPWQECELRLMSAEQQPASLNERLQTEARLPFDLSQAPLWRVLWIQLREDEQVLALTFHHSIIDEWSKRNLAHELECLYAADGRAEAAGLPALPGQYADYAAWQRQRLTGDFLERQRSYWRQQLHNPPAGLDLPMDRPRPARSTGRGAVHHFQLSGPLNTGFRKMAREENTTLFSVMLAAFQVWLHRYTGQEDIVVGTPITGRERPEFLPLIGFFLNTLPIRVRLDGTRNFREVIRRVRDTLLDAFGHAELPFEQMVELALKERGANEQPLYQVMFVLLEREPSALRLGKARTRQISLDTQTSKNDLTFSVQAGEQDWSCRLEYATDLFSPECAARMARHLGEFLTSIAEDPQQPIGGLRLLPEAERQRILMGWNRTDREYPRDKCLHRLFEEQVERAPDAVAVVFEGSSLTYRELNERANQLARHLHVLGVRPEVLVGLCVERSLEMVVALLGILKAGGAYLPLDPDLPSGRLEFMLQDADVRVLITQRTQADRIGRLPAQVLWIDEFSWQAEPGLKVSENTPSAPAYVIYTSGSTGQPKGVAISHGALINCLCHFKDSLEVRPDDVWLAVITLSFDMSGMEIWLPLLAGARVRIATRATAQDGKLLSQALAESGATILQATPATWQGLLLAGWPGNPALQILCGGEAMPPALAERLAVLGRRAWNLYGPTETTIYSTSKQIVPQRPVTIGVPLANTQVYILDARRQPVPIGVAGELFIGGDGVARGYLNRPELTAERFIPDLFSHRPEARLYRTGDLARWRTDGEIEYLGRTDQQVKILGYRIELGEIESVLGGHPEVAACAVVAQDHGDGNKMLVAFVVGRGMGQITAGPLRRWMAEQLPAYMIPSQFVVLPALPLNSNGKVDRKVLEKLEAVEPGPDTGYVAPRNDRERKLAEIWQAVLRRERVGVQDNFFNLGGHSLLAMLLSSQIQQQLGVEVPLRWIFEHPTIEALAILVLEKNVETREAEEVERLLAEVEALEEETAIGLLIKADAEGNVPGDKTRAVSRSPFHCPDVPSAWFGRRRCNLIILINEDFEREGFERLAGLVREFDPLINVVILPDQAGLQPGLPPGPTLTFSPAFVRHPQAARGKTFCGYPMGKSQEYTALEQAGFPVPKWVVWSESEAPDLTAFGQYVVQKPDHGGAGAEVKVMRKDQIRWTPITTAAAGTSSSMIIQELIHTGPHPVCYRVNTLFGRTLYCMRLETPAPPAGQESLKNATSAENRFSIVANEVGSQMSPSHDEEIIRFGEVAAHAFPDIPLLGLDIIREVPSGKLYVLEANAIGYVWKFHSNQVAQYGYSVEDQFDGVRKAAYILAEKTQQHAC